MKCALDQWRNGARSGAQLYLLAATIAVAITPAVVLGQGDATPALSWLLRAQIRALEAIEDPTLAQRARDLITPVHVVFLPGIMGSSLRQSASPRVEGRIIWGKDKPAGRDLFLADEDADMSLTRAEVLRRYQAFVKEEDVYETCLLALERRLTPLQDVQVEPWGYDWRLDIERLAEALDVRLAERHWQNEEPAFVLVGHSMGGVIAWQWQAHLDRRRARGRVARIFLIGAPLEGSADIARTLIEGNRGPYDPRLRPSGVAALFRQFLLSDTRIAAFTYPSIFELLPDTPDYLIMETRNTRGVTESYSVDLTQLRFWQRDPLGQAILHGEWESHLGLHEQSFFERLNAVLRKARNYKRRLDSVNLPMTVIYGTGFKTPKQLTVRIADDALAHAGKALSKDQFRLTATLEDGDGRVLTKAARNRDALGGQKVTVDEVHIQGIEHGKLADSQEVRDSLFKYVNALQRGRRVERITTLLLSSSAALDRLLRQEVDLDRKIAEAVREAPDSSFEAVGTELTKRLRRRVRENFRRHFELHGLKESSPPRR